MHRRAEVTKRSTFKSLIKNPFAWLAFFFGLYSFIGFIIVPIIAKSQIIDFIKNEYKRKATIQSVTFNPYIFTFSINGFTLYDKDKSIFVRWKEFYVDLNVLPLLGKKIELDEVKLVSLKITAKKLSETEFNFSDLLGETPKQQDKKDSLGINKTNLKFSTLAFDIEQIVQRSQQNRKGDNWDFFIHRLAITSADLIYEDSSLDTLVRFNIIPLNLRVKKLHPMSGDKSSFTLDFKSNDGGSAHFKGNFILEPISADITVKIDKLNFRQSGAYFKDVAYLRLDDGNLSLDGTLKYGTKGDTTSPEMLFVGTGGIGDLKLYDTKHNERFLEWGTLTTKGLSFQLTPMSIIIGEVQIDKLYSRIAIAEDQTINILKVFKITPDSTSVTDTAKPALTFNEDNLYGKVVFAKNEEKTLLNADTVQVKDTSDFKFDLGRIKIKNSEMYFSDFSLPLKFATDIHDFNGEIVGVSYGNPLGAAIDLEGIVDEYGLARIKGNMDLFDPMGYSDIKTNFNNIELTSLSPYSAKFMGYMVERGKLSLDVQYILDKGILTSYSKIFLNRLELGEEVEGEEGFGIPVKLALALLKDGDGNVDLDFEVTGDLNDPEVDVGALIWWAVKRVLLTIVTAPFRFLGSLLGINGDDLEFVDFDPGESKLLPNQVEKLTKLNEALNKRPNITLEIIGTVDTITDGEAIRIKKLRSEFTKRMIKAATDTIIDPMKVDVSISKTILDEMYTEKFGAAELDSLRNKYTSGGSKGDSSAQRKLDLKNYLKELITNLKNEQPVSNEEVMILASKRAEAIRNYMLTTPQIKPERLVIEEPEIYEQEDRNWVKCQLEIGSL